MLTIDGLSSKAIVMELWQNVIKERLSSILYQAGQQWKQYALTEDREEIKYGANRNRLESFRAERILCQSIV